MIISFLHSPFSINEERIFSMIASIALRRSIRNYKHSPVPQDFVEQIL